VRLLTVHGHFYQPPRENPWLEEVEREEGAAPFHDWNERITAECYSPNADNLQKISFNFGPTLLSWLQSHHPDTYAKILEADRISRAQRGGHGNAIAQAYNHVIMPLASRRDKVTQVRWGIEDFRHRFGRDPEGMWLPETAVDKETLAILAEAGLRFTILAPTQARRVRALPDGRWQSVAGGKIDPSRAYRWAAGPEGSLALFFYDSPISRAIAFEGALADGETLRARLVGGLSAERTWPQLVNVATDGESYGHHHPSGDHALAAALQSIESGGDVMLTNYGAFLAANPPTHEVEIIERTSWSCTHGVDRWRSDCGCRVGHPGWHQRWRAPLREAMDWLRDQLDPFYEARLGKLLKNPWAARDDYIQVILDPSEESRAAFFSRHQRGPLEPPRQVEALKLLELQRQRLLMFTSCGWFFDDISGLEAVQVLKYAARAMQLAAGLGFSGLEEEFLRRLKAAPSNLPDFGDGAEVYRRLVAAASRGSAGRRDP
jgi:alpha-amylase/alpha-mannosidase (GH57 family)